MSGYQFAPNSNQIVSTINKYVPIVNNPYYQQVTTPNVAPCGPCSNDPLYNLPPGPSCPPPCEPCKKTCKCKKCCSSEAGPDDRSCGPAPCGPIPCGPVPCGPAPCIGPPVIFPNGPRYAVTTWRKNYLVSNKLNIAAHLDVDLINPWGIAVYNNQLWVANSSSDAITNYDLFGNKILASVYIRDGAHNASFPTGIAINCAGGFPISNGSFSRASLFMVCTERGTVHAYNPFTDNITAFVVLNKQIEQEVSAFRGLTIANNTLYLADFFQGHIDVFDSNYGRLLGYYFIDGDTSDPIPLNYAPNNIVNIGCYIYILYARRDDTIFFQDLDGPGNGYISVFNLDGSFVRRFTSRGVLNSPWAMIPAPCECGFPPGSFLVGNNGDGRINIFDCNGRYVGPMLSQNGLPLIIPGLWGLAPHYTDFSEIFFTSAPDENIDGLLGSLVRDQVIQF